MLSPRLLEWEFTGPTGHLTPFPVRLEKVDPFALKFNKKKWNSVREPGDKSKLNGWASVLWPSSGASASPIPVHPKTHYVDTFPTSHNLTNQLIYCATQIDLIFPNDIWLPPESRLRYKTLTRFLCIILGRIWHTFRRRDIRAKLQSFMTQGSADSRRPIIKIIGPRNSFNLIIEGDDDSPVIWPIVDVPRRAWRALDSWRGLRPASTPSLSGDSSAGRNFQTQNMIFSLLTALRLTRLSELPVVSSNVCEWRSEMLK